MTSTQSMLWLYISGDTPWAVLSKASEKRFPDELLTEEDSCADTEGLVSNIKNMAKKKKGGGSTDNVWSVEKRFNKHIINYYN